MLILVITLLGDQYWGKYDRNKKTKKILRPTTVIAHSELGKMVHTSETPERMV